MRLGLNIRASSPCFVGWHAVLYELELFVERHSRILSLLPILSRSVSGLHILQSPVYAFLLTSALLGCL